METEYADIYLLTEFKFSNEEIWKAFNTADKPLKFFIRYGLQVSQDMAEDLFRCTYDVKLAKSLMEEYHVSVNCADKDDHAVQRSLEMVKFLLAHGADVNSRNNIGVAPVHRVRNVKELAFLYYHGADLSVTIQGTSIFYLNDDPAIQQFIRNHRIPVQARRTSEEPEEAESSEQDEFLPLQEYAQRIPPDLLAVIDSGDNTYFQIMLEIYATNESLKPLFYYLFLNKKYDLCETLVKSSNFHQVLKDEFKPILLKRQQETGIRKLLQFF